MFGSTSICVSFHLVEQLITEHMISMTTDIEWKQLSSEEQLDINMWTIFQIFLAKNKRSLQNLAFVYELEIHDTTVSRY